MAYTADQLWESQADYNLRLVAPNKGEAKKTASQGEIYLGYFVGMATDDILSICCEVPWGISDEADPLEGLWRDVYDSIFGQAEDGLDYSYFNISPDKLRKFSLLEPRGKYPVAFKAVEWRGIPILRFKMGPYTRGSLALLDNFSLRERFPNEDVLWP